LCGSKTFHRTETKIEEDDRGEKCSDVTIEYGWQRSLVTFITRGLVTLASSECFLYAFIDDHVRIHGHAGREYKTGDTGSRERGPKSRKHTNGEQQVQDKRDVSNPSARVVIHKHQEEDHDE